MRREIILFTLLGCFLLCGCQALERKNKAGAAVEVYGHYLYQSTLDSLTFGLSGEDSTRVAQQYITQWTKDNLLYELAMRNVRNADVERLVEDYRRTLYVHAYENFLVDKHMPKTIEDSTILHYYNQMPERFRLAESVVKGLLVVVPKDAPKINDLRKWMGEWGEEERNDEMSAAEKPLNDGLMRDERLVLDKIEKYSYQNASGYELFTDRWLTTTDLLALMPVERAELEALLKTRNRVEVSDTLRTYLLQVTEKYNRGELAPIDYARPEIEKMVLNTRQVDFLQRERERLYEEAVQNKKVVFY